MAQNNLSITHKSGYIHGDISTSNILITIDGMQLIDPMGTKIGNKAPGGTPGWCAPEQTSSETVSAKTDIYSLGLLIIHILKGVVVGEETAIWIATKQPGSKKLERKRIVVLKNPKVTLEKKWLKFKPLLENCLK